MQSKQFSEGSLDPGRAGDVKGGIDKIHRNVAVELGEAIGESNCPPPPNIFLKIPKLAKIKLSKDVIFSTKASPGPCWEAHDAPQTVKCFCQICLVIWN
jgi:hypothetical protein